MCCYHDWIVVGVFIFVLNLSGFVNGQGGILTREEYKIVVKTTENKRFIQSLKLSQASVDIRGNLTRLSENRSIYSVITIRNFLNDASLSNGYGHSYHNYGEIHDDFPIPSTVGPMSEEAFFAQATGNSRGTSGVVQWDVDKTTSVALMWSIPYNFDLFSSYVAVGFTNYTLSSIMAFESMYNGEVNFVTYSHQNGLKLYYSLNINFKTLEK